MTKNESFKLLDFSDDSETVSDLPEIIPLPKKKRLKKRLKPIISDRHTHIKTRYCEPWGVGAWCVIIVLLIWTAVLSSITVVMYGHLQRLEGNLREVAASGQGASEALQKCHATTRDLRQNQTRLGVRVLGLESAITNITHQALSAAEGLARVEQRLLDKPELLNVPRDLVGLENSVAQIGSQIRDLVTTTKTLKDQAATVDAATLALKNDVNMLKERVSAMENNTRQPNMSFQAVADRDDIINRIGKLSLNVTSINETLSNKLQWALDDQHKDHKILEGLQEMNQSMTARISTLEGSCSKTTAEQASLLGTINSLTDQITSVSDREKIIETRISELQAQTQLLYSNDTQLKASIAEMKQAFQHLNEGTLVSLTPPKAVSEMQNNVTSTPLSTASSVPAIVTNGKGLKPETTSVG